MNDDDRRAAWLILCSAGLPTGLILAMQAITAALPYASWAVLVLAEAMGVMG